MTTTRDHQSTTRVPAMHLAFELGLGEWKLGFTVGLAQATRLRTISALDREAVLREIARAKAKFGLPADAPVHSCYEAGRDGFWLHRWLVAQGIDNVIVDSASIEVNRRQRRAKSDRLDADKLVRMLVRYHQGERKIWSVVRVPDEGGEDGRQLHRELELLKDERTEHSNRIKGLLYSQGIVIASVAMDFAERLKGLRTWDGQAVSPELQARLLRELARWQQVDRQVLDLEAERRQRIKRNATPQVEKVRQLLRLKGIGLNGAWLLVRELFGWRTIANRRQLAALVGLTPTPYTSGKGEREQGISKAGSRRLRRLLVELSWGWLRFQPNSALTRWFACRFDRGKRQRKVGVVAVARKLLIALWRWLEHGEIPAGAIVGDWRPKVGLKAAA